MPTKLKVGDAVFYGNPPVSYFVEDVDYSVKTADIRTTAGAFPSFLKLFRVRVCRRKMPVPASLQKLGE